ncbi:type VII secretion protein EccB [Plantactinospora solaniradicis]|uniref:Type VII secretion protein EccB n=1 Tax=Plantactinospora solaniradicis TaxID=1723736 RepID=A0ABW1KMH7_9ACTN
MASRRDQLHAYQFLVERVISGLVTRESDPEQPPFRRPIHAAYGSIAVAVIALAVVGVYGVIVPGGNKSWRGGDAVVVEKETGTRYVYLDGRLHPVANYASALLALDRHAGTRVVSRNSLVGVARGPRIGIPDAPDALPAPKRLLGGEWTFCSRPSQDRTGAAVSESVLMVGQRPSGGDPLAERALLVGVAGTGERHLVLRGHRHEIGKADGVAVEVALRAGPAIAVSPAVLDVLPAGRPIGPIAVRNVGKPSRAVPGRIDIRAGQVLVATGSGGVQRYLAEIDRLRPITELQYDIQLASRGTAAAYPKGKPAAVAISLLEAAGARQAPAVPVATGDPPVLRPEFAAVGTTTTMCLLFAPRGAVPTVLLDPEMPAADPFRDTPANTDRGTRLADRVLVPGGGAAVVESRPSPEAPAGTLLLVTDLGIAYPVAEPRVLEVLGYPKVRPVGMPAGVVSRLPIGTTLSHDGALRRSP